MKIIKLDGFGYCGYSVSEYGNVYSHWIVGRKPRISDTFRELRIFFNNKGRKVVRLHCNNKIIMVHKLVALAFLGERPVGLHICHNDGNFLNNHYTNLRYDTPKENIRDKIKHKTMPFGEKSHNAKLNWKIVNQLRQEHNNGANITQIAIKYKLGYEMVRKVIKEETWRVKYESAN